MLQKEKQNLCKNPNYTSIKSDAHRSAPRSHNKQCQPGSNSEKKKLKNQGIQILIKKSHEAPKAPAYNQNS